MPRLPAFLLAATALLLPTLQADDASAFGQATSEAAMIGIFYDLKQTQEHSRTTVDPQNYWNVLDQYLAGGWDESILEKYYRGSRPLYTTQIFIPNMNANLAPKAFGADKSVKPSRWIIHYKAQVSPPEDGVYRFVGGSDDLLAVAVNGKTELVSPLRADPLKVFPKTQWRLPEPNPHLEFSLKYGDWFPARHDQPLDLDVIIGERPGGNFNAFLLIQKQGGSYVMERGTPVLPIFQLASYNTAKPIRGAPDFSPQGVVWKSYQ